MFWSIASKDGLPNVVPIGAVKFLDDETLLISDHYFGKTLANLRENPRIALAWWGEKEGYQVKADGHFGPKTRDAVKNFQRDHPPLSVDGVVSVQTWPKLVDREPGFTVLDCIDVDDGFMGEVNHARRFGGNPLGIGGMSKGVEQAIALIAAAAPAGSSRASGFSRKRS